MRESRRSSSSAATVSRALRRVGFAAAVAASLAASLAPLAACSSGKPNDTSASAEPVASASSAPSPSSSAARVIDAPPPEPPTLRPVAALVNEIEKEKTLADGARLFTVPGAILVATWNRVGRLTPSGIEWKGSLDVPREAYGRGLINWVGGSYPDAIDITWSYENGRAAQPTYSPLTGKGASVTFAHGGGGGWIHGAARVGETVVVSGFDMMDGQRVVGARGPAITRLSVAWGLKCGDKKPSFGGFDEEAAKKSPAVRPTAFAATPAGTLFSYGLYCDEKPAVEVWAKEGGNPKIIELDQWLKDDGGKLLAGSGDDVWITSDPILAWKGDRFEPLPKLPRSATKHFVSTQGELHVADASAVHRWNGERFVEVARLVWPADFEDIAVEDGSFWVTLGGRIHRLEKGEPVATGEACKTPLVHLYDVAPISEPTFTFPATRKALSSFSSLEGIQLVDFQAGRRRLGAIVPSWDVGVKLAAHIEKNMKDEHPHVVCFAPEKPRVIPVAGGK